MSCGGGFKKLSEGGRSPEDDRQALLVVAIRLHWGKPIDLDETDHTRY